MYAFDHVRAHAARTAELAAEAAERRLAREAAPVTAAAAGPVAAALPALRNRLGEALVAAGTRLMQPARVHTRYQRGAA
ncbi:hypothetical protein ACFWSF_20890 [Streptomyces sp. NPDC058611]|uniref:hypothetical protein n=1 Tax=unclassified Streptomyces TaxID=2593676 RepID=UPI00365CCA2E